VIDLNCPVGGQGRWQVGLRNAGTCLLGVVFEKENNDGLLAALFGLGISDLQIWGLLYEGSLKESISFIVRLRSPFILVSPG